MTACTYHQLCLMPFADGLFPAFMVRDQYGDKAIRADDTVLIAKVPPFDPFGHLPAPAYTWGTWIPAPVTVAPQITAASLAGPTPGPAVWHPVTPSQPWWPSEPHPEWPCWTCQPPFNPPLPEPAPVPLPASAGLLLVAVAAFAIIRRRA